MALRIRGRGKAAASIDHGRRLLVSRQLDDAVVFLESAVERFPNDAEIRVLYATVLLEFRQDEVGREARKAAELGRDDPVILVRAGGLLLNRGDLDGARACLTRARELADPDFVLMAGLLNREGILASRDREFDLAEKRLVAAVDADPTSAPFAIDLARLLGALGRQKEAVEVVDRALARVEEGLERMRAEVAPGA